MSSSPLPSGHTRDFEELAGLAALRALEGDELSEFERHAQTCPRCRAIERADREAVRRLALLAQEMDPSAGFKERLMQRAAAELAETSAQAARQPPLEAVKPVRERQPVPLRPRLLLFRRPAWVASLAAVLVIALAGAGTYTYMNQVVTSVALSGTGPGQAVVVVRRSGAATLELRGLPNPQPGYVYEAWIIPPNQAPVPAGTTSTGQADLPLSGHVQGTTVAITLELAPGVNAPTNQPLLAAPVVS
jgi:anti-sigma-K factor RskA